MIDTAILKDATTTGLAAVGAVLGVMNTWKALDRDRPKLRVLPRLAFTVGPYADGKTYVCFDVTNLSQFALTITEVGFLYWWSRNRAVIFEPTLGDGGSFPRELKPRTSLTAYAAEQSLSGLSGRVRCAYAKTDCGLIFKGNSPAFRQMARSARRASEGSS